MASPVGTGPRSRSRRGSRIHSHDDADSLSDQVQELPPLTCGHGITWEDIERLTHKDPRRTSGRSHPRQHDSSVVNRLYAWIFSVEHFDFPYPSDEEKLELAALSGLEVKQLNYWLTNVRKRVWGPIRREKGLRLPTNADRMRTMAKQRLLGGPASTPASCSSCRPKADSSAPFQVSVPQPQPQPQHQHEHQHHHHHQQQQQQQQHQRPRPDRLEASHAFGRDGLTAPIATSRFSASRAASEYGVAHHLGTTAAHAGLPGLEHPDFGHVPSAAQHHASACQPMRARYEATDPLSTSAVSTGGPPLPLAATRDHAHGFSGITSANSPTTFLFQGYDDRSALGALPSQLASAAQSRADPHPLLPHGHPPAGAFPFSRASSSSGLVTSPLHGLVGPSSAGMASLAAATSLGLSQGFGSASDLRAMAMAVGDTHGPLSVHGSLVLGSPDAGAAPGRPGKSSVAAPGLSSSNSVSRFSDCVGLDRVHGPTPAPNSALGFSCDPSAVAGGGAAGSALQICSGESALSGFAFGVHTPQQGPLPAKPPSSIGGSLLPGRALLAVPTTTASAPGAGASSTGAGRDSTAAPNSHSSPGGRRPGSAARGTGRATGNSLTASAGEDDDEDEGMPAGSSARTHAVAAAAVAAVTGSAPVSAVASSAAAAAAAAAATVAVTDATRAGSADSRRRAEAARHAAPGSLAQLVPVAPPSSVGLDLAAEPFGSADYLGGGGGGGEQVSRRSGKRLRESGAGAGGAPGQRGDYAGHLPHGGHGGHGAGGASAGGVSAPAVLDHGQIDGVSDAGPLAKRVCPATSSALSDSGMCGDGCGGGGACGGGSASSVIATTRWRIPDFAADRQAAEMRGETAGHGSADPAAVAAAAAAAAERQHHQRHAPQRRPADESRAVDDEVDDEVEDEVDDGRREHRAGRAAESASSTGGRSLALHHGRGDGEGLAGARDRSSAGRNRAGGATPVPAPLSISSRSGTGGGAGAGARAPGPQSAELISRLARQDALMMMQSQQMSAMQEELRSLRSFIEVLASATQRQQQAPLRPSAGDVTPETGTAEERLAAKARARAPSGAWSQSGSAQGPSGPGNAGPAACAEAAAGPGCAAAKPFPAPPAAGLAAPGPQSAIIAPNSLFRASALGMHC